MFGGPREFTQEDQDDWDKLWHQNNELLEALKREHRRRFNDVKREFHLKYDHDCPVCQLIRRCEGER